MAKSALLGALCAFFSPGAIAAAPSGQDLGVLGPVYPIKERDMLQTIRQRLETLERSGELDRLEQGARRRAREYAERPPGLSLPAASATRVHHIDPTVTVPYDITDHEGRVIHPAGTSVNPLKYKGLSRRLLFIDGDRPDQVAWARQRYAEGPAKVILVKGPVKRLMQEWGVPLFFDQYGRLVDYFEIRSLPASVVQEGERLRVEEIHLEGKG